MIVESAKQSVNNGLLAFSKFLSANETGNTGGHQAGIYISKPSIPIIFDEPGNKGSNKDRWVTIRWQNDFNTNSRFVYYGSGTRDEYRITNFGKGFPFLAPEYIGALFILVKTDDENYDAFILNSDDEISDFLDAFGMSPVETNGLIRKNDYSNINDILREGQIDCAAKEEPELTDPRETEYLLMQKYIAGLNIDFPTSFEMSHAAREIHEKAYNNSEFVISNPDRKLVEWTDMEYKLFRMIERERYGELIKNGFSDVDTFITAANMVLNRRKSRAGKSLEHHLAAIFDRNSIFYDEQTITEGRKRPDFIFPSAEAYHDMNYSTDNLAMLAAKTTCKDRWRQVLNEADRLKDDYKYLCTLQQGISATQLEEMRKEKVRLIIPKQYLSYYPMEYRNSIWTVKKFIEYIKEMEEKCGIFVNRNITTDCSELEASKHSEQLLITELTGKIEY